MIPSHIRIDHYRALRGVDVLLGDYTVLVGPNGVGKSTVLDALDFFLSPSHAVEAGDFQHGCDEPISVTVTLTSLSDDERAQYAGALNDHGNLVVTKVVRAGEGARYEMLGRRHRGFDELREVARTAKKTEFASTFKTFAGDHPNYGLKVQRSFDDNLAELVRWESEHPDECEEGAVPFAFVGSTKDQLIPSTRFVYVPAVQEASDTMDGARSPLTQMLSALVYPRFEADTEFLALQAYVRAEYLRLFPASETPELASLAGRITSALESFCPGTSVKLKWGSGEAGLRVPPVRPEIVEDGVPTDVGHKGHGLQRALIIAMLQAEDEYRRSTDATFEEHVVLMIEEPELYQHPTQCRHFRRVLANLAMKNAGIRVLVTTHSPDFISLDGIDAIRILRREPVANGVPRRKVSSISLDAIMQRYSEVIERPVDQQRLFRQLHVVDSIVREAFFATAVALVEGSGDHGLLSAQCALEGIDLEGEGLVVIACDGKTNMPLPICVLRLLGIKHYAVFDSDTDAQQNRPLLRALGVPEKSIPKNGTPETAVHDTYAILKPNIEHVVRAAVGAKAFDEATVRIAEEFGRTPEQTLKNPVTAERVLLSLRESGRACGTLHEIATQIAAL